MQQPGICYEIVVPLKSRPMYTPRLEISLANLQSSSDIVEFIVMY